MLEKDQLTMYINLLAELAAHYDDRFECIVPFSPRSDELLDFMWANGHRDENEAFANLAGILSDCANTMTGNSKVCA